MMAIYRWSTTPGKKVEDMRVGMDKGHNDDVFNQDCIFGQGNVQGYVFIDHGHLPRLSDVSDVGELDRVGSR